MDINHINRRQALWLASSALLLPAQASQARASCASCSKALADLERQVGGRLGVAVLDTASGRLEGHRLNERFAFCSTFKLVLAAAILREVDQGRLQRDQWVRFGPADVVAYAPITSQHMDQGGMRLLDLAEAVQTTSDNVAANVLLKLLGGPSGFTAILRAAGDRTMRLDRLEPQLNVSDVQDLRDTTTPGAMVRTTASLLTGHWLSPPSQDLLAQWMVATQTGAKRLRAGLPAHWRAGDKTGTGMAPHMPDKYNDVAIAWPPGKAPLVIAAFFETSSPHPAMRDQDQAVLAEVGRIAAAWSLAGSTRA
jgi:beta-lactamase class A